MTDSFTTDSAQFTVDVEARTVRGLLIPYGEVSSDKAKTPPISFSKGTIKIPKDLSVLSANLEHSQHYPVGRITAVEETDAGLVAEFAIGHNEEGDEFIAQYKAGTLRKLSAEVRAVVRDKADSTIGLSALLTGAAFCSQGAFASAGLFSIDTAGDDLPTPEQVADATPEELLALLAQAKRVLAAYEESLTTEAAAVAEETPTETPTETEQEEDTVANATVPTSLATESSKPEESTVNGVFNLIARAKDNDETALMALSDIKISGTGALPAAGVLQPAWLGELWSSRRNYDRKYMSLINNGTIRAIDEKGFILTGADELVQPWAGNKAALPSGSASTAVISSILQKWGYGADIAREFFDLPGGEEVINAFLSKVVKSYARVTDRWTLEQIVAAAIANSVVAPATYPTGYPAAMGMLIQGIEAVSEFDVPTFAIVNDAAWTQLRYTPKDQIPEYVTFGFGSTDAGTAAGVRVVKGNLGANYTNTPSVLVGSKNAAHVNEVAGASPIQLDALDIARGGVDKAVIGYTQFLVEDPEALVFIGAANV
jgi:hypothetical protein